MADPHVAFGSGYSALGAGKLNQIDNELMEAPEDEDDFDVLNEETFGDIGDTDYDWEKQHERFAEVLEASSFTESRQNGETTKDSGFDTAEKSYRMQEEIMEQSITHLVLDEDEERSVTDPAIINASKGSAAIPFSSRKEPHLEQLFGPSSPPAFLDTEHLVSPTSKNIWGSPARDSPFSKPVNNLQALFDFAKGAGGGSPTQTSSTPSVIRAKPKTSGGIAASQSPIVPPSAQTLAEIENQLLKKKAPTVMTAEELERQLRGEMPPHPHSTEKRTIATPGSMPAMSDHRSPFSMPVPIPPIGRPPGPMMPNFSQPPPGFSPGNVSRSQDGRNSPLTSRALTPPLGGTPPGQPFASSTLIGMSSSPALARSISPIPSSLIGTSLHTGRPPSPVQARLMSPYNSPAAAAILFGNASRGFSSPVVIPRGPRGPSPYGPMGSPGQRFPPPSPITDPSHMMRGPPPGRGGYNNYYKNSPSHMPPDRHFHGQNNNNPNRYFRDHRSHQKFSHHNSEESAEDSYDGLMTQKEKDWIIKIQLMQLQTDNPYLDDYYYTYYTLKKKAKERQRLRENGELSGDDDPKLVIPNLSKVETKAYTPAQFEGSLGRLTTASVHNPRTIIDLSRDFHPKDESQNVSKELRRVRQLLMDIEKGFLLLLDIDDLEKKLLALPEESRMPLVLERREKVDQLFHFFSADENIETFIQTMSVRKGRKLLSRVLPLLDPAQACIMVSLMLCNLSQLMRKDQTEEGQSMLTDSVNQALHKCSFEMLSTLGEQIRQMQIQGKAITAMLQNKFGNTILCTMLQKVEDIYKNTSPVDIDNQLQTNWCHFVELFVECLSEVTKESVVEPVHGSNTIVEHLERLLNKKLVASVEDKLSVITAASVAS